LVDGEPDFLEPGRGESSLGGGQVKEDVEDEDADGHDLPEKTQRWGVLTRKSSEDHEPDPLRELQLFRVGSEDCPFVLGLGDPG
jgi:hypothetical protein